LLTTLFLGSDGPTVFPLVIVAAVVSYVGSVRLTAPPPREQPAETKTPQP
jgi:chloride channel protein, CIC family